MSLISRNCCNKKVCVCVFVYILVTVHMYMYMIGIPSLKLPTKIKG